MEDHDPEGRETHKMSPIVQLKPSWETTVHGPKLTGGGRREFNIFRMKIHPHQPTLHLLTDLCSEFRNRFRGNTFFSWSHSVTKAYRLLFKIFCTRPPFSPFLLPLLEMSLCARVLLQPTLLPSASSNPVSNSSSLYHCSNYLFIIKSPTVFLIHISVLFWSL
jgi:hypothetical protein